MITSGLSFNHIPDYGYDERREEVSNTLFFSRQDCSFDDSNPTLVNIFYTTRGLMTKVNHPTRGYNELWRSGAYDSLETLANILEDPRMHTGKGYRTTDQSIRGCARCGEQKRRAEFSKNQWRKGPDACKCHECVSGTVTGTAAPVVEYNHKQHITCDGCATVSPSIRCETCTMAFYCSPSCRDRNRRVHQSDCIPIEHMRSMAATRGAQPTDSFEKRGYAMATMMSGKQTFEALLLQAEYVHQEDGNWDIAIALYKEILGNFEQHQGTPPQWRQVWMGFSRCFYEIGEYDKAIGAGSAALEMNRHFPQAHKYVALAYKASGELELAKAAVSKAILYEAPWDDDNLQMNKRLWDEMFG
mmetsp:Transcript_33893/g.82194  ORF Transcript_33893/g.82194 Transcript_33893/m.82194 type:complete len:358 (+) Transcript_33893:4606-5679(+)